MTPELAQALKELFHAVHGHRLHAEEALAAAMSLIEHAHAEAIDTFMANQAVMKPVKLGVRPGAAE